MWHGGEEFDEPGDFDVEEVGERKGSVIEQEIGKSVQKLQISNNIQINVQVNPAEVKGGAGYSVGEVTGGVSTSVTEESTVTESILKVVKDVVNEVQEKKTGDEGDSGSGSTETYIIWIVIGGVLICIIILCIWLCYR